MGLTCATVQQWAPTAASAGLRLRFWLRNQINYALCSAVPPLGEGECKGAIANASRYYTHKVQDISSHQIYIVLAPEWGQRKNKQNLRNMRFCITRCLSVLYLKVSRSEDMLSTIFFFLRAACIAINKNQSDPKKETLLAHRRRGDQLYLSRSLSGYGDLGRGERVATKTRTIPIR